MNFPKDGLRLHKSNFAAIGKQLQPLLDSGDSYRMILKPWREKRSLPQNNLSHLWYEEISAYLVKSGRTDATKEWVKRNLKKTYLGCVRITAYPDRYYGERRTPVTG